MIDMTSEHWFHQGGDAMYVLTLFSIVVIAITLEKVIYLSKVLKGVDELKKLVRQRDKGEMESLSNYALYPVFFRIMEIFDMEKGIDDSLRLLDRSIKRFENGALRGIGWLATIGNTAPFVGLFGTVVGIIKAFTQLSAADPAAYGGVSAGIAEALIATASGLVVAVPAVILYNYLLRRISHISIVIRLDLEDFLEEHLESKSG